jgi:tripartite-type tricarboxylate transporter receptor subunit TctC
MRRLGAAFAIALAVAGAARAQENPAAFYQNKQVQFFTMGGPGGGYDTYTRAIAARLEKAIGARVLPINEPAAGGLVAMNRLLTAKPDGLSILLTGGEALAVASLMGEPGVNYDLLGQTWLARVSAENKIALIGPKSPYKSLKDMIASDHPVIWVGSGKIDGNTDFQSLLAWATGMKAKMIIGYKGTGGMNIAMESGEADARIVSDEAAALYGPSSGMRAVVTMARKRAAQFPDTPTVFEASKLSPDAERMLDWRAGVAALGRVIAEYLRSKLREILTDPDFIAEMKKTNLSASYANADDVGNMMKRAMTTLDAKGLAEIKTIIVDRYF